MYLKISVTCNQMCTVYKQQLSEIVFEQYKGSV